jgi:hypothetical protein
MFSIKIVKQSYDSFSSEIVEDLIDYEWKNIETAKKALQMIKEHHEFYRRADRSYGARTETTELAKTRPWFSDTIDVLDWDYQITLPVDDEEVHSRTFVVNWVGWGSDLMSASVMIKSDEFTYVP